MIKAKGLIIRQIEKEDVEKCFNIFLDDPERELYVTGNLLMAKSSFSTFLTETRLNTICIPLVIERKGEIIGVAIINNVSLKDRSCQFRFLVIKKETRKRGHGVIAIALIIDYLFNELNLNRISARTWSTNSNMDKIYKKMGAQLEGMEREAAFINGKWVDCNLWGMLAKDYK